LPAGEEATLTDLATLTDDVSATAEQFATALNRLDVEGMVACFTVPSVILDGMAPHVWTGPDAPADWCRDALAEAEHLGASDITVSLDTPLHNTVTDDAAYFVAPATMAFKVRGRQITQTGALLTLALRRVEGRWLISAWTWTKGSGGGFGDVAEHA
jgi:ketosteroid isomerase-like protein